jgi:hypothetical protein
MTTVMLLDDPVKQLQRAKPKQGRSKDRQPFPPFVRRGRQRKRIRWRTFQQY